MNSENIRLAIFLFSGILISVHDIKTKKIYVCLSYACLAVHLISQLNDINEFISSMLGGLILFAEFFFVRIITKKSLGMGDVHYSLYCGSFATLDGIIQSSLVSSMSCMIYSFFMTFVMGKPKLCRKAIPFAPFMFGGTMLICMAQQISKHFV